MALSTATKQSSNPLYRFGKAPVISDNRCPRCRATNIGLAVISILAIVVLYWMSATFGTFVFRAAQPDSPFVLLAKAFLHGQLHVDITPSPELLKLANPYDPIERGAIWFPWDLSLYDGKFYVYWGPVPALLYYIPWQWLTGVFPEEHQIIFLLSLTTVALLALLAYRGARALLLPTRGPLALWLLYIAFAGTLPIQLGGGVYVIAALSALIFQSLCLLLLISVLTRTERNYPLLFAAGVCAMLAIGSRPTSGLIIVPAGILLAARFYREGILVLSKACVSFFTPVVFGGVLLLVYNWLRFDSPFEIGATYQLTLFDGTKIPLCAFDSGLTLSRVTRQLWYHFVSPMAFTEKFPFVLFPVTHPSFLAPDQSYVGTDAVTGIIPLSPLLVIGTLGLVFSLAGLSRKTIVVIAALLALIVSTTAFISTCRFAATRYTFEIYGPWLILSIWGTWSLLARIKTKWLKGALNTTITLCMMGSILIGILATFDGSFHKSIRIQDALDAFVKRAILMWD